MRKFGDGEAGISTVAALIIIFVIGIVAGGGAYFVGSQTKKVVEVVMNKDEAEDTVENESSEVSNSLDEKVIEKELNDTSLNSIESDINDVDNDATSLQK